jgi:hypothetical protein
MAMMHDYNKEKHKRHKQSCSNAEAAMEAAKAEERKAIL